MYSQEFRQNFVFLYTLLFHINWRTIQETMKMMTDNLLSCIWFIFTLF